MQLFYILLRGHEISFRIVMCYWHMPFLIVTETQTCLGILKNVHLNHHSSKVYTLWLQTRELSWDALGIIELCGLDPQDNFSTYWQTHWQLLKSNCQFCVRNPSMITHTCMKEPTYNHLQKMKRFSPFFKNQNITPTGQSHFRL